MSTATAINRLVGGLQSALIEHAIVTVTVRDTVRLTGLSERWIRRLIAEGRIKSTKVGAKRLLKYEDVRALVEER